MQNEPGKNMSYVLLFLFTVIWWVVRSSKLRPATCDRHSFIPTSSLIGSGDVRGIAATASRALRSVIGCWSFLWLWLGHCLAIVHKTHRRKDKTRLIQQHKILRFLSCVLFRARVVQLPRSRYVTLCASRRAPAPFTVFRQIYDFLTIFYRRK